VFPSAGKGQARDASRSHSYTQISLLFPSLNSRAKRSRRERMRDCCSCRESRGGRKFACTIHPVDGHILTSAATCDIRDASILGKGELRSSNARGGTHAFEDRRGLAGHFQPPKIERHGEKRACVHVEPGARWADSDIEAAVPEERLSLPGSHRVHIDVRIFEDYFRHPLHPTCTAQPCLRAEVGQRRHNCVHTGRWGALKLRLRLGGVPQPLTTLDQQAGESTQRCLRFCPEARLCCTRSGLQGVVGIIFEDADINVYSMASGQRKTLLRHGGFYVRYLPSGHLVYMHAGTLFAVPFDLRGWK